MSYNAVKTALDEIAEAIKAATTRYAAAKATIVGIRDALANLPSKYSDEIAEIAAYTPTGAFETLAKDERAKLATEFNALQSIIDDLIATTEWSA